VTIPFRVPEQVREPLIWSSGALALFMVFIVATFPYGVLHARLLAEFTRASGMDVRVGDWSAGFPVAVEWRDIVLTGTRGGAIRVDSLQAKVAVVPAIMGAVTMDLFIQFPKSVQTEQGRVKGMIKAASWSLQGPMEVKARWQQVELSSLLRPYISRGLLQGEGLHRWDNTPAAASALTGEGAWKAEASELALEPIPMGQGTFPALSFTRVTTVLTCRQSLCDVTELKGEGPDGSFTILGQVTVQRPIEKSMLSLKVSVLPGAGLSQKLGSLGVPPIQPGVPVTFQVMGPADAARVAF
jgi:type II secretion system protein N